MPQKTLLEKDPSLMPQIIQRLKAGATIKDTIASVGVSHASYHNWINRGKEELTRREKPLVKAGTAVWERNQIFVDFFEGTARACAEARISSAAAFRGGASPTTEVSSSVETFTETRLNNKGQPYEYTRVTERRTETQKAGDWRAAMEYLARTDPDNWSRQDRLKIEGLRELQQAAAQAGISLEDLLLAMAEEIRTQDAS